jgi:hypothetical protein
MKFARITFIAAGIIGILILIPLYFQLEKVGTDTPPPVTHPEFYYGFVGVALAFQFVFIIISTDPRKYRPLMLAAIFEKFAFVIPTFYLYSQGSPLGTIIIGALLDLMWGILFVVSYFKVAAQNSNIELASELEN